MIRVIEINPFRPIQDDFRIWTAREFQWAFEPVSFIRLNWYMVLICIVCSDKQLQRRINEQIYATPRTNARESKTEQKQKKHRKGLWLRMQSLRKDRQTDVSKKCNILGSFSFNLKMEVCRIHKKVFFVCKA